MPIASADLCERDALVSGFVVLNLHVPTPDRWLAQVESNLDLLLIDHAHCEKKAAGVAMNLLFSYVENAELTRAMTEIVHEELDHFHQVRAILDRRGIRFYKLPSVAVMARSCTSW